MTKNHQPFKFWFVQALTASRLLFIILFISFSLMAPGQGFWVGWALALIIIAALTDLFDGALARHWHVTSRFGGYVDPFMDKIFYLATLPLLIYLAERHHTSDAPLVVVFTILYLTRDMYISLLRSIGALYHVDGKANWSGKVRTLISFPTIICMYYYYEAPPQWTLQLPHALIMTLMVLGIVINVVSIQVYTAYYWPWIKKELARGDDPHG